jgi:thioredoxin-related protein
MRVKLDTVANIATLAACVAILISLGIRPRSATEPPAAPQPTAPFFQKGDTIPAFDGLHLHNADQTLLLVLKHDCHFCAESIPFYQRLPREVQSRGSLQRIQFVMLTADDPETAKQYMDDNKLALNSIVTIPPPRHRELKVPGTPTLILVDRAGVIQQMWLGELDASREAQLISLLLKHS